MLIHSRILGCGLAIVCGSVVAIAQETPAPVGAALTPQEITSAARLDNFSIPTPGETLTALSKHGKLDWAAKYRPPIATNYPSRPQMALNLGGLIADGYIAVEAEDTQQVKNIGRDISSLAKGLGVQREIIDRGKSLEEKAQDKLWDTLKEELEATQNEVKLAMADKNDSDLVALVTVGGWIRGMEVISGHIAQHYSEDAAKVLRQPAIVSFLRSKLEALPEKLRDDPAVKRTRMKLLEIETTVAFPQDKAPTVDDVKKLNQLATDLSTDLAKKNLK